MAVMVPKALPDEVVQLPLDVVGVHGSYPLAGKAKFGWLVALKKSVRNCTFDPCFGQLSCQALMTEISALI